MDVCVCGDAEPQASKTHNSKEKNIYLSLRGKNEVYPVCGHQKSQYPQNEVYAVLSRCVRNWVLAGGFETQETYAREAHRSKGKNDVYPVSDFRS